MSKHKLIHPRRKWLKRLLLVCLVLIMGVGVTGWQAYRHFESNIKTEDFIESSPEAPRPIALPEAKNSLNILLMGSDDRKDTGIAGETPGLSDTTIFMHIAKDRSFAYGVSIPRDAMVERPACPRRSGAGEDPGGLTQFNSAFAVGGPACTVATVEQMTGVRVDHFAVIDFNGFRAMVDAIGGVDMCVPEEVNDPIGDIYLDEGTYTMDGNTALDYVRVRHGIGNELGDIGRMKRQQAFIAALSEKVMSSGTLANPVKTFKLLEAVTDNLTTDPEFKDLRKLANLGSSLKGIGLDQVQFVTAPFELWSQDRNRVILTDNAEKIWTAMKKDKRLPSVATGLITPQKKPTSSVGLDKALRALKTTPKPQNKISNDEKASYGLCS